MRVWKKDEELIQTLLERDRSSGATTRSTSTSSGSSRSSSRRSYLTPEEEVEKKRLQKLKLAGKDRIMEILSRRTADATDPGPIELMRHTISVLVENEFGVLARVAGLFSGRGFNIESLSVAETLDPDRLAHHAGHPRRRSGARADQEAAEQARPRDQGHRLHRHASTSSASSC